MAGEPPPSSKWDGQDYSQHSGHHRAFDDWFLERHPPAPSDVVLDLGCGSGEFSARLASLVPDGRVIGIDPDASMIDRARGIDRAPDRKRPNLRFVRSSAQEVDQVVEVGSVDLVVSRAMLHWLPLSEYPRCFAAVFAVLRPGGWFHSESGGAGNVPGVVREVNRLASWHGLEPAEPFPDAGAVLELVEQAGFETDEEAVRTVAQRRAFTRDELVAFLRSQAAVALTRQAPADQAGALTDALAGRADRLRRHDGSYDQTFVRLEILARRPPRR